MVFTAPPTDWLGALGAGREPGFTGVVFGRTFLGIWPWPGLRVGGPTGLLGIAPSPGLRGLGFAGFIGRLLGAVFSGVFVGAFGAGLDGAGACFLGGADLSPPLVIMRTGGFGAGFGAGLGITCLS